MIPHASGSASDDRTREIYCRDEGAWGWSRTKVDAELGVEQNAVIRWETGRTLPTPDHLARLRELVRDSRNPMPEGEAQDEGEDD